MRLDGSVRAIEFDGLLHARHGIDGGAENVSLGVPVDISCDLLDFVDLGLALESVEEEDT